MRAQFLAAGVLPFLSAVLAQDGAVNGPKSSSQAAGYNCDPEKCKLPSCNCASTSPPGGLSPADTPMFIVFTADDAIQTYTIDSVNQFLAHRKNPNGCQPKITYYTSLNYTNYALVTDFYVAGNEIADHTMTHVGKPSEAEVSGNLVALNQLAGIPLKSITGFRAPFLDYSVDTLTMLHKMGFTYDSSATSSLPVTDPNTDAFWPYTLDNGLANDCLALENACKGKPQLPGFWEIPMYASFDNRGVNGVHLMDPYLDTANGNSAPDNAATLDYLKNTFTDHYKGNRQPFGLYFHPVHLSPTLPGTTVPTSTIRMINAFLDWAQQQQNVWIVSSEQLLAWVRNPTKVSDLNDFAPLKCSTPQVDAKICNGMPKNEEGLLARCAFPDFPFSTCYGCPVETPSPSNPNPAQATANGEKPRKRLSSDCATPFWDPIEGKCICTSSTCAFVDESRAIGPNGANLTGGELGSQGDDPTKPNDPYVPFNAGVRTTGTWLAIAVGVVGGALGALTAAL